MKKFREYYGMAFRGKEIAGEYLGAIKPLLWRGDVDGAIALMADADASKVKNVEYLKKLTDYLNRVRTYIQNYAMRAHLGLRNSSGLVEKANDLAIAKRQKHDGMAWSKEGSTSLASVSSACLNGEIDSWVRNGTIPFRPIPVLDRAA